MVEPILAKDQALGTITRRDPLWSVADHLLGARPLGVAVEPLHRLTHILALIVLAHKVRKLAFALLGYQGVVRCPTTGGVREACGAGENARDADRLELEEGERRRVHTQAEECQSRVGHEEDVPVQIENAASVCDEKLRLGVRVWTTILWVAVELGKKWTRVLIAVMYQLW